MSLSTSFLNFRIIRVHQLTPSKSMASKFISIRRGQHSFYQSARRFSARGLNSFHLGEHPQPPRPEPTDFPLPGYVNSSFKHELSKTKIKTVSCLDAKGILDGNLWRDHQVKTMASFGEACSKMDPPYTVSLRKGQCQAHVCPTVAKKEFNDLFPEMDGGEAPLTVVTLTLPTTHDMSAWSDTMEEERDELTRTFIEVANSICSQLKSCGYWADFIDPASGRPYLGPFTNATLFETDGRLSRFGVHVEDLGCCKVVSHREWGTRSFVAALFTNAPKSAMLMEMIDHLNSTS